MANVSSSSLAVRELVEARRAGLQAVLDQYRATNARLFGSVARGDASENSDLDVMVDLLPDEQNSELLRISGLTAGFEQVLGRPVDIVVPELLRAPVSKTALADAIPL